MRAVTLSLLVAACGPPARIEKPDFADRLADALCDRTEECMRGTFESMYFDQGDCRAHVSRGLRDLVADLDESEDCVYDAEQAASAYADVLEMTCERFYESAYADSFAAIWDCDLFVPGPSGLFRAGGAGPDLNRR